MATPSFISMRQAAGIGRINPARHGIALRKYFQPALRLRHKLLKLAKNMKPAATSLEDNKLCFLLLNYFKYCWQRRYPLAPAMTKRFRPPVLAR